MAHKRAFSKTIVDTDAFQDMSQTAQLLYFYLNMNADDDGFVGNPKRIMRAGGFAEDDFKVLIAKRFLLVFENGVVVIKHWLIHNTIRKDRYNETSYLKEKEMLRIKENKAYTEQKTPLATKWQPMVTQMATQDKIKEDKIREDNTSVCKSFISSSGKKIELEVAENYVPDGFSPLQAKQARKMMERSLGKKKTNRWASFVFGVGWDFLTAYESAYKRKYFGNVILDEVAKNLAGWFERGETRETIREMILVFLESEKKERVGMSPTTVFSVDTYNKWKNGELKPKKKHKEFL
jgi:hypothetical protein